LSLILVASGSSSEEDDNVVTGNSDTFLGIPVDMIWKFVMPILISALTGADGDESNNGDYNMDFFSLLKGVVGDEAEAEEEEEDYEENIFDPDNEYDDNEEGKYGDDNESDMKVLPPELSHMKPHGEKGPKPVKPKPTTGTEPPLDFHVDEPEEESTTKPKKTHH